MKSSFIYFFPSYQEIHLSHVNHVLARLNFQARKQRPLRSFQRYKKKYVSRLEATQRACVWVREAEQCLILLSAMVGQIGARQAKERDPKQHLPQTDHSMA